MTENKTILAVDDSKNTLKVITAILRDDGFEVLAATSGAAALEIFTARRDIAVILSDLKMPGMDGLELYRKMAGIRTPPPFVIMTAHGTVRSAVQAMGEGVANYLIKPLDYEELVIVLNKAAREYEQTRDLLTLRRRFHGEHSFHGIIGAHPKMQEIFDLVRIVGTTDAAVLITGETGTGKELLSQAIHRESDRRKKAMVCINSAALSESLLEAELFGHAKGAFTGAAADRQGRWEAAHQSTLFLDEIGHMSLRLQAKLLRFLEEMTFEPVGSSETRRVDVRLIAATNLDLQKEIENGRFLSDLLYRLEVITVRMPPLRERMEDIPLLVDHFIRLYALQYRKSVKGARPELIDALMKYPWPGNVRELTNCLARAVILSPGARIGIENLPEKITSAERTPPRLAGPDLVPEIPPGGIRLQTMERELIRKTIAVCRDNKSQAAQFLGISRKALYQKIKRYGIEPK